MNAIEIVVTALVVGSFGWLLMTNLAEIFRGRRRRVNVTINPSKKPASKGLDYSDLNAAVETLRKAAEIAKDGVGCPHCGATVPRPGSQECGCGATVFAKKEPKPEPKPKKGKSYRNCDLMGAVFRNQDLRNADFRGANCMGTIFSGADLRGADFRNADLMGAVLRGAKTEGAQFEGANMMGMVR